MKNGFDISTATGTFGPSKINLITADSPRLISFNYKYDWEHYIVNIKRIPTQPPKTIKEVRFSDLNCGYIADIRSFYTE